MKHLFYIFLLASLITSCKKGGKIPPIDNAKDLDGTLINDSSLVYPERFLLSVAKPNPTSEELNKSVLIAVHGFSATTFEWIEMRDFAAVNDSFLTSLVLLGGHGRDYADFKTAQWENWQEPIIDEYNKLRALGYTKINIIASSTGCPLVIEAINSSKIDADVLKQVFLIDPILVPSNKMMTTVKVAGPFLSYSTSEMDAGEDGFWYKYRPYQAIDQLNTLIKKVRKKVEKGISLPSNVHLTVYKSNQDESADPVSASILYKGIRNSDASRINVFILESNLHVFTRLKGRNSITATDTDLQIKVFKEIKKAL